MAAPLSGAGQQQQLPITQALQPASADQNRDVRGQEQDPSQDQIQVREAPAAQTQENNTDNQARSGEDNLKFITVDSSSAKSEAPGRGSVVDIQV